MTLWQFHVQLFRELAASAWTGSPELPCKKCDDSEATILERPRDIWTGREAQGGLLSLAFQLCLPRHGHD